jgi:WD40 repeat protein
MKNLKNYIKNNQLFQLILLCAVLFSTDALAMRRPAGAGQSAFKGLQRRVAYEEQHKDQYFLYATGDQNNGIWVDKEFLKENCEALKDMIADFGETQEVTIPIGLFSTEVIKLGFDILVDISRIPYLSFTELINVANIFNFLGAPAHKMQPVLDRILANFNDIPEQELKKLNPDVQKSLMTDSTVNYLKDCIIKKYANERKQNVKGHLVVFAIAMSADGKKMVSGGVGIRNNLIAWNMTDPNNITHQVLPGYPGTINASAISPDSTKLVIGGNADQNYLMLWDITDQNNIVRQRLEGHPSFVNAVTFSPDGNTVVSGSNGNQNSLLVWDVTDINNITHQALVGDVNNVYSLAFSHDGKKMVSGSGVSLTLWDTSNLKNITQQASMVLAGDVYAVAFSPDDTYIVAGCGGTKNNLVLCDITDPQNITQQFLVGHPGSVSVAVFSHDGKRIASGCGGHENNLILWDMSNPYHITHQMVGYGLDSVRALLFTLDDKKLISGSFGSQNNLIIWTLLTDQEESLLKQLNNCTVDQMRCVYRLCRKSLTGTAIVLTSEEQSVFVTLPQDIQKFLADLIFR